MSRTHRKAPWLPHGWKARDDGYAYHPDCSRRVYYRTWRRETTRQYFRFVRWKNWKWDKKDYKELRRRRAVWMRRYDSEPEEPHRSRSWRGNDRNDWSDVRRIEWKHHRARVKRLIHHECWEEIMPFPSWAWNWD